MAFMKNGATPKSGSLCRSCRNSWRIVGQRQGEEIIHCQASHYKVQITFEVTECKQYMEQGHPELWELKKIAWIVNSDGPQGKIGFIKPEKKSEKLKEELDDIVDPFSG